MRRFHSAVVELSKMTGRDFETTIKGELAAVLTRAQKETLKASVKKIQDREVNRRFVTMNGKRYPLQKTSSDGDIVRPRYPSPIWREIQERRRKRIQRAKDACGLASRMWLHVAEQINVQLKGVPSYVRNAVAGRRKDDMGRAVTVYQSGNGSRYQVGFINALTESNIGAKAGRAFNKALTARANFFSQSVKLAAKGVIANVLARYPGLGRVS
jgi:hypothetical protein